jgi:hypothetical protein
VVPPASDIAAVTALVQAQAAVRDSMTSQATAMAAAAAAEFTRWYDSEQITVWATKLAQRIEPMQRIAAQSMDAYLARLLSLLTGRRVRPVGRIDVTTVRPGMTHAGAYGNVADAYRWQQAQFDRAARELVAQLDDVAPPVLQSPVDAAVERAISVAEMDTQLAVRAQAATSLTAAHERGIVTGYRRVIHPELSRGGTCGLCVAASDRVYHVAELMPIHHRCNCLPSPIVDGNDVGSVVNAGDLKRLYKDAGSTHRKDLKRTRYQVTDGGALGPLLEPEGNGRRVQRQVDARAAGRPAKTPEQQREVLKRAYESLVPALDKARALATGDPKKWGKYRDSIEARVSDLAKQLAA